MYDNDPSDTAYYDSSLPTFISGNQCCDCGGGGGPQSYTASADLECAIFDSGCSTPHTADVTVASSSPFAVTANQNTAGGYEHTLCYKCSYKSKNSLG